MSSKPLVSIIIPCKEVDQYTKESIAGCKQLDYSNFEIILLPDSSIEIIAGVKVIPTGPLSPGYKRNIGVKNAKGEFCAFIDNDAYPRSDWLANGLNYLENPQSWRRWRTWIDAHVRWFIAKSRRLCSFFVYGGKFIKQI